MTNRLQPKHDLGFFFVTFGELCRFHFCTLEIKIMLLILVGCLKMHLCVCEENCIRRQNGKQFSVHI